MVGEKKKDSRKQNQVSPVRGKDWERQFTVEEHRVSEYVELYESMGYEVRVEPAIPNEKEECQVCYKAEFENLRTIYVKRRHNKINEKSLKK